MTPLQSFVDAVADLVRAGVGRGLAVVAVRAVGDVALRGRAPLRRAVRVAEAVAVEVAVEGGQDLLVRGAVAVLVDAVADLPGVGVPAGVVVVAVDVRAVAVLVLVHRRARVVGVRVGVRIRVRVALLDRVAVAVLASLEAVVAVGARGLCKPDVGGLGGTGEHEEKHQILRGVAVVRPNAC